MRVCEIMRKGIPTLRPTDSAEHAARLLLDSGFPALPVLDGGDVVVGVVGVVDVLALGVPCYTGHSDLSFLPSDEDFPVGGREALARSTVAGLLACGSYEPVLDSDPVVEVARVMVQDHLLLCPVVRDGRMVGFITRRDLVRVMLGEAPPLAGDATGGETLC
jgi:CBS domain-containing protein